MTTTAIEQNRKIIALSDHFNEYEMKEVNNLKFDVFVYDYRDGGYDGSGFAVWKNGEDYYYHEISHCSCYGATDGLASSANAKFTLQQIKEIAEKNYRKYAKDVIAELEKNI